MRLLGASIRADCSATAPSSLSSAKIHSHHFVSLNMDSNLKLKNGSILSIKGSVWQEFAEGRFGKNELVRGSILRILAWIGWLCADAKTLIVQMYFVST